MSDLEEQLKWFEENPCSQSYSHDQPAFTASGGSAHHAFGGYQQQQSQHRAPHASQQQQQFQQNCQQGHPSDTSRDYRGSPVMRQPPSLFQQQQAHPHPQAQARGINPRLAPQGTMSRRPQTPQWAGSPQYMMSQDPDGTTRYYRKVGSALEEVDPVECGLITSPQYRGSPAAPAVYQTDPTSSSSLHSAASMHVSRTRPGRPHGSQQGFQQASRTFYQDDEDMFDQMDAGVNWDSIPEPQPPQRFRHGHLASGPAPPVPAGNPQMAALQRALLAERQRANMAESMLSRVHSSSNLQTSDPDLQANSSADMMISSPTVGHYNGTKQQRQALPNETGTSFEFEPQYKRQALAATKSNENANAGTRQQSQALPTGADNQKKGIAVSKWGLPTDDPLATLRKSAYVPPITTSQNIPIVPKSAIPDIFSSIFPFQKFNQVQSACIPIILKTDENMVVTAPTGAGKTVLFELAMIRLWQNEKEGQIVYIAPTKSLCSERNVSVFVPANVWAALRQQAGVELTGDTQEGALREAKTARVIITTPEKWDAVTRNLRGGIPWYDGVKVFCIDEVHLLAEERGATLEVIVSRMRTVNPDIRFVAVSATVPNIEDVAVWLGPGKVAPGRPILKDAEGNVLPPMARVMKFGDEFRPVPLQKHVHAYPSGSKGDQQFDAALNYKLLELIEKYASRKPVLIFCNTRKGCTTAAKQILKDYNALCNRRSAVPPWPRPVKTHETFKDASLADLAAAGIGTHHAGMDYLDRRLTEALYLKGGHLSVICTTSTLAVGINLPARMVIIKGTKIWDASQGKAVDYTDLDILQMMGRAGRPQFDSCGVAVIMCKQDEKVKYESMVKSQTVLESCLHKTLVEHINSEIATRTIKTLQDAYKWLRSSFLYVRIKANPEHYRAIVPSIFDADDELGDDTGDIACLPPTQPINPEKRLEEMVADAVKQLKDEGLAEEIGDDEIDSTDYGDMLCQYSIRFPTFLSLKNMDPGANAQQLLAQMCKAVEFKDLKFRSGEKSEYADWNKREEMQWPIRKVTDSSDKVNILIQLQLGGVTPWELKIPGCNPAGECIQIMQHIKRIVACVVDLATHKKDAAMSKAALELARCLRAHCWENTYSVLSQFDSVGPKFARGLADQGIKSIEDLRKAKPSMVEAGCGRKHPFGKQLIETARQMPDFEITAKIVKEAIRTDGVGVTCHFTISLKNVNSVKVTTKRGARKLTASILLMTSDNQWVEYKRAKVLTLQKGQEEGGLTVKKTVLLTKPSQKIECYVCCDEIAGLNAKAILEPTTPAFHYPIPVFDDEEEEVKSSGPGGETSDVDEDGDEIVKTKALKKAPAKAKPVDAPADHETKRLPNGNYRCRHACQGACRHTCCVEGLARKPKEVTKKVTKVQKSNYISDDGSETDKSASKTKKPPKKIIRRSAQEIVNSMKGSDELTSTNVKFDRLPRSPPSGLKVKGTIPWLESLSDGDETDTLPDITLTLPKTRKDIANKRARDPSPDNDTEDVPVKKPKVTSPAHDRPTTTKAFGAIPRARSATIMDSPPRIHIGPARSTSNVTTSPTSSPVSPATEPAHVSETTATKKQPLFRPPSVEAEKTSTSFKEPRDSDTEDSEIDELEQDSNEWMQGNVEITD